MLGNAQSASGDSWLSQSVTIPNNMDSPTLSFLYSWQSGAQIAGQFTVTVSDGTETESIDLEPSAGQWAHRWVDLSEFQGKTLTVQFQLNETAQNSYQTAIIDEVSLGSALQGVQFLYMPSLSR